jgi:hypothetical protein
MSSPPTRVEGRDQGSRRDATVQARTLELSEALEQQTACVCRKPRPFDPIKESRNVGHDGRATLLPFEAIYQPTRG